MRYGKDGVSTSGQFADHELHELTEVSQVYHESHAKKMNKANFGMTKLTKLTNLRRGTWSSWSSWSCKNLLCSFFCMRFSILLRHFCKIQNFFMHHKFGAKVQHFFISSSTNDNQSCADVIFPKNQHKDAIIFRYKQTKTPRRTFLF